MSPDQAMPSFHKAGSELADRFRTTMAAYPEAPVRNTFGSPCAYVNGNMALGLHGSGWFMRLDPEGTQELTAAGGEPFMPMPGRPMTGYTRLPESIVTDKKALTRWIERSLQHVATMPPKAEPATKAAPAKEAAPAKKAAATGAAPAKKAAASRAAPARKR